MARVDQSATATQETVGQRIAQATHEIISELSGQTQRDPSADEHAAVDKSACLELANGRFIVDFTSKIGQGTFGCVYEGKDNKTGRKIAVKQIHPPPGSLRKATTEINSLQKLSTHDNIVTLYEYDSHKNAFYLFLEYCDAGNLRQYFEEAGSTISVDDTMEFIQSISSGVDFMHSKGVIHRDLKPANILLKRIQGKRLPRATLSDFGLAKLAYDMSDPYSVYTRSSVMDGTTHFWAPELFDESSQYTASIDVFSVGLVFAYMIDFKPGERLIPLSKLRQDPFGKKLWQMKQQGETPSQLCEVTEADNDLMKNLKALINCMAQTEFKDRPSARDVKWKIQAFAANIASLTHFNPDPPYPHTDSQEIEPEMGAFDTGKVQVSEASNPAKVKVHGPAVEQPVNTFTSTYMIVDCREAGPGEVAISLTDERGLDFPVRTTDQKDNTFRIEFEPSSVGTYHAIVFFANKEIPSSPFKVIIAEKGAASGGREVEEMTGAMAAVRVSQRTGETPTFTASTFDIAACIRDLAVTDSSLV